MKIAAFDFDGTLHHPLPDGSYGFNPADLEALAAWRNAGHLAIAATGRSRSALAHGLHDLPADADLTFDYQVLANGGLAATDDGATLLFAYPLDPAILHAAIDAFGNRDGMAVFGTTTGAVDGVFANNTGADSQLTAHFSPMTKADIAEHTFAVVPLWVPDNDALRAEVVVWAQQFDTVTVAQNQEYVDIMAPGRNKGAGILELLERIGLGRGEVDLYTFGDSWNDLAMHNIADHSYSFHHSPEDVQAATDYVIGSIAEVLPAYT